MKRIVFLFLLVILLFASLQVRATSTIDPTQPASGAALASAPVRNNFNAAYNDINALQAKFPVSLPNGGLGATTAQGGLDNLFGTSNGAISPVVVLCPQGGADAAFAFAAANVTAQSRNSVMIANNCYIDSQVKNTFQNTLQLFYWGGGPNGSAFHHLSSPIINILTTNIGKQQSNPSFSVPGAAAFDMNGGQATFNGINFTGNDRAGATIVDNSAIGVGGNINTLLDIFNSAWYNANSFIGPPTDGAGLAYVSGSLQGGASGATLGSGYVDGLYNAVPLVGGSGIGGTMNIHVTGGVVDGYAVWNGGRNYVVGDVLIVNNSNLGGSGSGFSWIVPTVSQGSFSVVNTDILPRLMKSQLAGFTGTAVGGYTSDVQATQMEIGAGQYGFNPQFGGPNDQLVNIRCEFLTTCAQWGMSYQSSGAGGHRFIDGFQATHNYGNDFNIEGGDGFLLSSGVFDQEQNVSIPVNLGGNASLTTVMLNGLIFPSQSAAIITCVSLAASPSIDYLAGSIICNGSSIVKGVTFNQLPTHMILADAGAHGALYINGEPIALGTGTPHAWASMNIDATYTSSSWGLPVGTTGQRPSGVEGMIRDNTTLHGIETFVNSAWITFVAGTNSATPTQAAYYSSGTAISGTSLLTIGTSGSSGIGIGTSASYSGGAAGINGLIVQGNVSIGTTTVANQFSLGNAAAHAGRASCWTTNGAAGYCTTTVDSSGNCTCTGL